MTELVVFTSDDQATLIILEQPRAAVLTEIEVGLVVMHQDTRPVLVEPEVRPEIIMAGVQGPAGIPGPDGQGGVQTVTLMAGADLAGFRVVRYALGLLYYADKDQPCDNTLGILTAGAATLGFGTVQLAGRVTNPAWNWVAGPVYLGNAGQLTQVAPTSGVIQEIGFAVDATSVMLRIQEPVYIQ